MKGDACESKSDVSELKEGLQRLEKEMRLNTATVNLIAGERVRMDSQIVDLERAAV